MEKKMSKRNLRKAMRMLNHKIMVNLVNYMMGPKWPGTAINRGYQINSIQKSTSDDVIKVYSGYGGALLYIYFGHNIRIATELYTINYPHCKSGLYHYFETSDVYPFVNESEEQMYIRLTTDFLRELCNHAMHIEFCPEHYNNCGTANLKINNVIPEELSHVKTYEDILLYNYTYAETHVIEHMIKVFKSKSFKKNRG